MNAMHEQVKHGQFGSGCIIRQTEEIITVQFEDGKCVKNFEYPLAFEKQLTFENTSLQGIIREEVRRAAEKLGEERKRREEERRKRADEEKASKTKVKKSVPKRRVKTKVVFSDEEDV